MAIGRRLGWAFLLAAAVTVVKSNGQAEPQAQGASKMQKYVEEARKGAEEGDAKGQFSLAFYYQHAIGVKKDEAEAAKWYRRAAEQGDAGAQFQLAAMYAGGKGLPQNYAEAVRWYRKAAEQGEVAAQVRLAETYDQGKGVPQDFAESARWYREAAEKGNEEAQIVLSGKYEYGRGVPQDYVIAHMWINIAISRIPGGNVFFSSDELHKEAGSIRDHLAEKMTAQQIAEAQRLAREWKPMDASASKSPVK